MRLSRFSPLLPVLAMLLAAVAVDAQQNAPALAGKWEGTYVPKPAKRPASKELGSKSGAVKLPVMVTITAAGDGKLSGTWTSTGQQGPAPIEIAMEGETIRFTMPAASWEGKLSADGATLDGKWKGKTFQGDATSPLVLKRSGS